ncbi:MAG: hypothetical protein M0R00_08985 [Candidatus Omnitrophica bacterium]|jgi:hypothetical protein|nr:hypothetical protein [Candidatus Omnitrophota bacterium]
MKCEITKAENGFIMKWDEDIEGNIVTHRVLYEESEDDYIDGKMKSAFVKLFWGMGDLFDVTLSQKHDKRKVEISVK